MRKKNAQNATGHPTGSVTLTTGGERLYGVTYYTVKGLPCDTRQSCLGGKLDRALFDGGFCLLSGQHALYHYYVCDHWGVFARSCQLTRRYSATVTMPMAAPMVTGTRTPMCNR